MEIAAWFNGSRRESVIMENARVTEEYLRPKLIQTEVCIVIVSLIADALLHDWVIMWLNSS